MRYFFFFFKQKTAYEMRISDWSSDVCSSDLIFAPSPGPGCDVARTFTAAAWDDLDAVDAFAAAVDVVTYEFENVDLDVVDRLAASVPENGRASCRERVCQYV